MTVVFNKRGTPSSLSVCSAWRICARGGGSSQSNSTGRRMPSATSSRATPASADRAISGRARAAIASHSASVYNRAHVPARSRPARPARWHADERLIRSTRSTSSARRPALAPSLSASAHDSVLRQASGTYVCVKKNTRIVLICRVDRFFKSAIELINDPKIGTYDARVLDFSHSAIDHNADARDRQRSLGDVRRDHNLPAALYQIIKYR